MPSVAHLSARTAVVAVAVAASLAMSAVPAGARGTQEGAHIALLRSRVLDRMNFRMESEIDRLRERGGASGAVRALEQRLRHGCEVAEQLHRLDGWAR